MTDDKTVTFDPTSTGGAPVPILPKDAVPVRWLANRYELISHLGAGGMGVVYEARDRILNREVAVKMIHARDAVSSNKIQRFRREAALTSQLQHPNIIPLYDLLQDDEGSWFFVMKKVEGSTLRGILNGLSAGDPHLRAMWDRHRLLSLFLTVCQAIGYAHQRKVLHRDIKAENIMIGPLGEVYVMDWGIARIIHEADIVDDVPQVHDLAQTRAGSILGTISYMSPEQAQVTKDAIRPPSDVWSLGVLLARILIQGVLYLPPVQRLSKDAARNPFEISRELLETMRASSNRVLPDFIALCERALQPAVADRYPDAVVMAEDVQLVLSGEARRRRAASDIRAGRTELADFKELLTSEAKLAASVSEIEQKVVPWKPISDPTKVELREMEAQLDETLEKQARCFSAAVAAGERALSHDPGSREAKGLLSEVFWHAYERAEQSKDRLNSALYANRLRSLAVPTYCRLLDGDGTLTITTASVSADVFCQRFDQRGLVWSLQEPVWIGRTPLRNVPIAPGSYMLTLRAPGFEEARCPAFISRAGHWDNGTVRLLRAEQIPDGMVYVPAGVATFGRDQARQARYWPLHRKNVPGFLVSRFHVTAAEYVEFLNDIPLDEANKRRPRDANNETKLPIWYWPEIGPGERFVVPKHDLQGEEWEPQWPICGVSWEDATAFASWKAARTGLPYRLLWEYEWEKAARGADARKYPWGERFDASLCKLDRSRPGGLYIEPVGAFPMDCSVYGVRDLAGSMRDWIGDTDDTGWPADHRVVRGGSWSTTPLIAVAYNRWHQFLRTATGFISFRLALDLPKEE